jgi:hypothetical protein
MIAYQTAGRATRDALFLSSFSVTALPRMVIAAAAVSVVIVLLTTRLLTGRGPARTLPVAFAASAGLLIVEWFFVTAAPGAIAILFYLHYAALGGVLISAFWSQVNERFDPRTAKRHIGQIAAGASVGSMLGGLLTARVAATLSVKEMLPILAGMHVVCAWLVLAVERGRPDDVELAEGSSDLAWGFRTVVGTPYLRTLAGLMLLTTVSEVLIDYVFKARATTVAGGGLLRLFAWYYTAVAMLAVAVQVGLGRRLMERGGIARTIATLPLSVVIGGVAALLAPGLASAMALRGGEVVVRSGLYRGGWELLFAPLPTAEKRAAKPLMDVGVVRLGDVLGAAAVQLGILIAVGPSPLIGAAVLLSLLAVVLCAGLQRRYAVALERGLLHRARRLEIGQLHDSALRTALLHTVGGFRGTLAAVEPVTPEPQVAERPGVEADAARADPEAERAAALRSRDPALVRAALTASPLTRALVPETVPLLAWDAVAPDAIECLRGVAPEVVGQLLDHLLDPGEDLVIRRRLPLVLAYCPTQRAVDGLLQGLEDRRFEVRYRCGRALSRLVAQQPALRVDPDLARGAVLREVTVDRAMWEGRRLLDEPGDDAWSPVMGDLVRDRANRSLEHVFTVLALVLPSRPLQLAFHGLHTDDLNLRGTALEYLEQTLPPDVRQALWPFLEDTRTARGRVRPAQEVLDDLLKSRVSIKLNLEQLRRRAPS